MCIGDGQCLLTCFGQMMGAYCVNMRLVKVSKFDACKPAARQGVKVYKGIKHGALCVNIGLAKVSNLLCCVI